MNKITIDEMDRDEWTTMILRAKRRGGLGWAEIAAKIGRSTV